MTEQEINIAKQKHGEIFLFEVEDKKIYVKKPGRKELAHAQVEAMNGTSFNTIKYAETILRDCFISGDSEVLDNDDYFLAIVPKIEDISKRAEVTVKKL